MERKAFAYRVTIYPFTQTDIICVKLSNDKRKKMEKTVYSDGSPITGINKIDVKSDSRFYWTHRKHVKEYLEYMCNTLDWQMEIIG